MWNSFDTGAVPGMTATMVEIPASDGKQIHAYLARPDGGGSLPGIVIAHHLPGWDEFHLELTRRFAQHGYSAICPDLFCRDAHGKPDDVYATIRAAGGVADERVVADLVAALGWIKALPTSNGKAAVIGACSGGRHAVLAASRAPGFDAVIDLWGGRIIMPAGEIGPNTPVAPIDLTQDLNAPLLGLFGKEDRYPTPEEVDRHEGELKRHGKNYEFHRYDGAGHGFFYYDRPMYRPEVAADGWRRIFTFLEKHLG